MNKPLRGRPPVSDDAKRAWAWRRSTIDLEALAKGLGISAPAVYKWPHVPADRLEAVVRLTGLRPEDLRPDLYPHLSDPWSAL